MTESEKAYLRGVRRALKESEKGQKTTIIVLFHSMSQQLRHFVHK